MKVKSSTTGTHGRRFLTAAFGFLSGLLALGGALAAPAVAATSTCGAVITRTASLTSDLGPCPGDGILVGADNITIDLGGHTLSGAAAHGGETAGVRVANHTGVRVMNGTITGFDAGVAILGGGGNTVQKLDVHDNIGTTMGDLGDGVFISNSKNNRVQGNVIKHNGPFEGIGVFGNATDVFLNGATQVTTGNVIERNSVLNNDIVSDPFGNGPPFFSVDDGINLGASLDGGSFTTVVGNAVQRNGRVGILVCSFGGSPCLTTDNTVAGNSVEGNGIKGPRASDGISANDVIHIPGQPFYLDIADPSARNLITNNVSRGNEGSGIWVSSRDNRILNNVALGNNLGHLRRNFDLNGFGNFGATCDNNWWWGNTYHTFFPTCVTTGGHQAGSPVGVGVAGESSAAFTASEGAPLAPVPRQAPTHQRHAPIQ